MRWEVTPYLLPLLLAGLLPLALAAVAWRRRAAPGAAAAAGLLLAVACWALAYLPELASVDLPDKLFWYRLKYVGIAATPLAWLVFALHYTGRARALTRRTWPVLAVGPLATVALALTNPLHHLLFRRAVVVAGGPFRTLALDYGPWFWIHTALSYAFIAAGTWLLLRALVRSPGVYRGQAAVLAVGVALPWIGNVLTLLDWTPVRELDLTPFAFALAGLCFLGGLLRFRLLDLAPIAREAVVERLRDGVVVLDDRERVVDLNPAARRLLGLTPAAVGRPADAVLPAPLADAWRRAPETAAALALGGEAGPRDVALTVTPLRDRRGRPAGHVLTLRDLTAGERQYRALFAHDPNAIVTLDPAGLVRAANPACARIFGQAPPALLGRPLTALVAPGDRERLDAHFRQAAAGTVQRCEAALAGPGGRRAALAFTLLPAVAADRVTGVYGIAEDITARREAEAALRASEAKNQALLAALPDLMFRIRGDGTFLDYQARDPDALSAAAETLVGRTIFDALPRPVAEAGMRAIGRTITEGTLQHFEYRLPAPGGARDFEARLVVSGPEEVLAIVRDVTERKRAEDAQRLLADAGALLATSLDYTATLRQLAFLAIPQLADWCLIDVVDGAGAPRRLAVAPADPAQAELAREIACRGEGAATGALARVLRSARPEVHPALSGTALAQLTADPGFAALAATRRLRSVLVVPLVARGRTLGALSFAITESERRYGETDLALARDLAQRAALAVDNARLYEEAQEAIRARDRFLSIASHELRTPVAKIMGYTELLLRRREAEALGAREPDGSEHTRQRLLTILDLARHLGRLTRDLLDVSRLSKGQLLLRPAPLDLADVVAAVGARYREQLDAAHPLTVASDGPCPLVADPDRVEQVLTNLLENAVKYSPGGGPIEVGVAPDGGGATVTVRDAGVGLPPGAAATIFEPFGRASNVAHGTIPGLGMGLYICRDIVAQHGGRIWAASPGPGEGTTVGFWLPAAPRTPAEPEGAAGVLAAPPL
ncbi:MAG TPA: histidine kinase N-terminal 7TM domain-containing protein [Thermomicrobiales bacterium]|nr:histidine kinase N-terminal 7TM domain-containing protein [Thermomicrobiales bacterium]